MTGWQAAEKSAKAGIFGWFSVLGAMRRHLAVAPLSSLPPSAGPGVSVAIFSTAPADIA